MVYELHLDKAVTKKILTILKFLLSLSTRTTKDMCVILRKILKYTAIYIFYYSDNCINT